MTKQPVPRLIQELHSSIKQGNHPDIKDITYDDTAGHHERMDAMRPELYVLTGLLLPFAVERFIGRLSLHPPFGVEEGKEPQTYHDLSSVLMDHSEAAVRYMTIPGEKYKPVINRFESLVRQYHEIRPESGHTANAKVFLTAGLNTAIEMSVGALSGIDALARVERPGTTRDEFLGIARRSSRLASNIATHNIDRITSLRRALKSGEDNPYFNPSNLTFIEKADGPYVDYKQPLSSLIDPHHGKRIGEIGLKLTTIGCPALYSPERGVESSIKTMWNQVSETVAAMRYPA